MPFIFAAQCRLMFFYSHIVFCIYKHKQVALCDGILFIYLIFFLCFQCNIDEFDQKYEFSIQWWISRCFLALGFTYCHNKKGHSTHQWVGFTLVLLKPPMNRLESDTDMKQWCSFSIFTLLSFFFFLLQNF